MSPDCARVDASLRWPAWACTLLVGALLAACASTDGAKPSAVSISSVGSPDATTIRVSERNDGADVTLESAQQLIVSLPLDVVAGVDWSLVDLKPGVLAIRSTKFERTSRGAELGDLGGLMIWTLKPVAPGAVTLSFDLRRPHSLLPAVRTVTFQVMVR